MLAHSLLCRSRSGCSHDHSPVVGRVQCAHVASQVNEGAVVDMRESRLHKVVGANVGSEARVCLGHLVHRGVDDEHVVARRVARGAHGLCLQVAGDGFLHKNNIWHR